MPNIKSAKKRVKVAEAKTLRNKRIKSALKTDMKKFAAAAAAGSPDAPQLYAKAVSAVDKARLKGVLHRNKADRFKSQLSRRLHTEAAQ